ncbi:hypothetical protein SLEP1_g32242 [Rubroshorea leprosula]|uniref:Uncharacterized protein n=1 Tax=Rubroshorea leprosula TaxID=152421 RepID=A0AAV5KCM8_9ROSI|nr:hypothetical protein SLEP1_g32242 [Rubroshorea leprosula]
MEFIRNEVDALYHEMVVDAMGAQSEYNDGPMAEELNSKAREFYDLLHAVEVHISAGGQNVTVLSWMAEMLNMKTLYNMSAANWEMALSLSRKLLSPEDQEKVPKDFYSAKKNDKLCGESHYEPRNMSAIRQKDVPRKSLWYLPITPRLQRLYMSRKTAEHMTWHLKCHEDADEVIHPAGSEAWKHFDETHPTFADEPRNVKLALYTDDVRRGTRGASSFRQQVDPRGEPQRSFRCLIRGPRRDVPTQQQLPSLSQPPAQQQISSLIQLPTQLQQEQPTVTQPPLADDQFIGDDATMEEENIECNLEAELEAEYDVLDPKLDAQLEEKLSRAVPKTGRGMDKGDDAPADSS